MVIKIFKISREWNWGTRWPRKYTSVYVRAPDKNKALQKFNSLVKKQVDEALEITDEPLAEKVKDLHDRFKVHELKIFE